MPGGKSLLYLADQRFLHRGIDVELLFCVDGESQQAGERETEKLQQAMDSMVFHGRSPVVGWWGSATVIENRPPFNILSWFRGRIDRNRQAHIDR
jgi:hypothetical protein